MNAAHNATMQSLSNKVNGSKTKQQLISQQPPAGVTVVKQHPGNILLAKLDKWSSKKEKIADLIITEEIRQIEI